jgi:hypothetical protein
MFGRIVFGILMIAGNLFLIYDGWIYYRYYNQVKTRGQVLEVPLTSSQEIVHRPRSGRSYWYTYTGTVNFRGVEKRISISKEDYQEIKPGQKIPVLYEPSLDDMMSVRNPLDYRHLIAVAFVLIICCSSIFLSKRKIKNRTQLKPVQLKEQAVY